MRKMKTLLVLLFAAGFFLVSTPSVNALAIAPAFNSPITLTIQPGETRYLICTVAAKNVKAVVERLTTNGKVVGPYYFNISGRGQYQMGNMTGTSSVQDLYFSYWDGTPGNALLYLSTTDTTEEVTVRVTFYNVS